MKSFTWLRARKKTAATIAGLTIGAVTVTGMAIAYEGNPTTEVDLHDGSVWVTNTSAMLVGHFNNESRVLDGGFRTADESYDILQSGDTVFVDDKATSALTEVDPVRVSLGDSLSLPPGGKAALGGETLALLDPAEGKLWVLPSNGASSFDVKVKEPVTVLGAGADVAVSTEGTVYAVSSENSEVVTVRVDAAGVVAEPTSRDIDLADGKEPTITVVGEQPVVLDGDEVIAPRGVRANVGNAATAVLQQPSAASDAVVIATGSQLVSVPLDGSEPTETSAGGEGNPAAPVQLQGCTYGAWAGSARFVRDCAGEDFDLATALEGVESAESLVFRVNRDVVVLNDVVTGSTWVVTDSLQRVDNWNDITPPEGDSEEDEQTTEETVETTLPERSDVNTPPVAEDDSFGVRPGGSTMLPVLDNDTDADGDVLVATLKGDQPRLGEVQQIFNGASLQINVPEDATGSDTFVYEVDDGRGGTDQAQVTVTVHGWDVNSPPRQRRTTAIAVESGGTVSYNVLPDWIDPDGDDIYLKDVQAASGDEVEFTTDGQITYRAVASLQGRKDIDITVGDGQGAVAAGTLRLDVRPPGSTLPKTNADHVVTRAGESVVVSPLVNDTSSGREPLRLARVDDVEGADITADFPNKKFTFRAEQPGVYYAQYLVSAGPNAVPGLVRVDVLEAEESDLPPVAVRDVALLPSGGDVLVGVLNNDSDPSGGVLVVQSVQVPQHSGVSVTVLNHATLRITDQGALEEQVRIKYTISNGSQSAEGDVVVLPVPAPEKIAAPIAGDDHVVVRAGDVVTIPVLDNDSHPQGDKLTVAPDLVEPFIDPEHGEAFVSQDTVRFRAGNEARTVYATYEAVDSRGQKDAGYITIQILEVDEENNSAPRPRDITARTLSGSTTRIAVPLDGIDPDGDSVELLGLESAPTKGQVQEVGQNFLVYEAFDDAAGVDSFSYRVRDRLGKEAVGSIRVGIAPPAEANQAPYAVKDSVVVRPGRTVAVPVMVNDSDPDGDAISLVADGLIVPDVEGLEAEVSGDRVVITVPDRELETSVQYTIRDARGAQAVGVINVTVGGDVPLQPPIARDDRVLVSDVADELTVDVEVLKNDEDPDGTTDVLELTAEEGGTVQEDGTVRVTVGEERQLIRYTITDPDGLSASAFIFVPALSNLVPLLTSTEPVEVVSGETITIPLSEHVTVAGGGQVRITEAAKVTAINSNGDSLIHDAHTLIYTSREGYFGKDAITFEVTDGSGPDDPAGRTAMLTLPVNVLPPANQPPTFDGGQMTVAPGEDATELDLAALTRDPDAGDMDSMRYSLVSGPGEGMTARVEGSTLLVEAPASTAKGTSGTVTISVNDGHNPAVEGSVSVTVSASTRPLAVATTDTIAQADQGKPVDVDVLANDINPFPDTPLKVVSAVVDTGRGEASLSGDTVTVTPANDFVGSMLVRYRVQDATGDRDREVEGIIELTVQGVPDAPGVPEVVSVQDRTVVLSWSPPSDNGAPITGYTVRSTAGDFSQDCTSTTCTLNRLTNNVEYTFTVLATNRVGDGPESRASAVARPDARPDKPVPPKLTFGDRSLTVNWTTPTTPGSPVEKYTLEISPAPPSNVTQKSNVTGNSVVWEGLENGVDYQVRVRAHNRAPEPSSWSNWSLSEIPAGPPIPQGTPTSSSAPSVGSQAQVSVKWSTAMANGDKPSEYQLRVMRGSTVVKTIDAGTATSQAVTVDTSTTEYTFAVRARNKAGWGDWGNASSPVRAFGSPGAPTITSTTEGNNFVTVKYSLDNTNGAKANEIRYEYRVNGGSWSRNWDGSKISADNNGEYTVQVRAYSVVGGQESQPGSPSSATGKLRPYGPVKTPSASASQSGKSVKLGWSAPSPNGRAIAKMQISIDGGSWEDVSKSGSRTVGNSYDTKHTIKVRAVDTEGQVSSVKEASAKSAPKPSPRAWVSKGTGGPFSTCGSASCAKIKVHTENFTAGTYTLECLMNGNRLAGTSPVSVSLPANGSIEPGCFVGYPGERISVKISGYGESESITWY
ncbi:Ig-like domain-containing protein [Microbacterium sp. YY-01]|uniref:Ig-like domain-containing protein n=1 Tax=Microbacterium sp. YY-01 TaxID=3421634 RepID=UPI003D16D780